MYKLFCGKGCIGVSGVTILCGKLVSIIVPSSPPLLSSPQQGLSTLNVKWKISSSYLRRFIQQMQLFVNSLKLRLEHKKLLGNFSSDAKKILCPCYSCRCIFLMWHQKCCKTLSQPFLNSWQFRGFEINGMHKRVELPVKLVDLASLLLYSEFRAGSTLYCWEGQYNGGCLQNLKPNSEVWLGHCGYQRH